MIFYVKRLIKYLLLPFGIVHSLFFREDFSITILMYHRVGEGIPMELAVRPKDFLWHMDYLKKGRYKVISMDDAYNMMVDGQIDDRYVVISFDDGYLDFYENAYPILKRYSYPSIVYVVPAYIQSGEPFWWDREGEDNSLIDMETLVKLSADGLVTVGSHTMNHIDMDMLNRELLEYELKESKKILEEHLGKEVRHFAYPRGIYSNKGEGLIDKYYSTGVLISNGVNITGRLSIDDRLKLKRVPVLKSDGKFLFVARLKGWLVLEEWLRHLIRWAL